MKAALALPPGDIYNLTVTACTERSRNTSIPHILKLGGCLTLDLSATRPALTSNLREERVTDG